MKSIKTVFVLMLALLMLACCGSVSALADGEETAAVTVSTVDAFIAAIAPNTTITLAAGTYDLSTARTYGRDTGNPCARWEPVYDIDRNESYELIITGADNLSLCGAGMDSVTVAAIPRYANVLHFVDCDGLSLSRLTAGHTEAPGWCAGGVLWLENCSDVDISFCGLFGCGTVGVQADRCRDVGVRASRIYDCSQYAVYASASRDVRVTDCDITGNGSVEEPAFSLLAANSSDGFLVADCRLHDNTAKHVLDSTYTRNTRFLSNLVETNLITAPVFTLNQYAALVDSCRFDLNCAPDTLPLAWYDETGLYAVGLDGSDLSPYELKTMSYAPCSPETLSASSESTLPDTPLSTLDDGSLGVIVHTADEFLAAIGSDRTIVIDTELLDLSTASDYGVLGGEYYFWRDWYDGPELVIHDVQNLQIRAAGSDPSSCTVAAVPRYANVLAFLDCSGIRVSGLTAGHTDGQGACTGGVLLFENSSDLTVADCRLYGCGILGVETSFCSDLQVTNCEIYDCSQGGVRFYASERVSLTDCNIHDVAGTAIMVTDCGGILWNGSSLPDGWYNLEDGSPVSAPVLW